MSTSETNDLEITESGNSNSDGDGNPFKGLRVLIVDDNKDDIHSLELGLHSLGSRVTCLNQIEATSLFREKKNKFDVVLAKVDWQIGFEFVEYVSLKMDIPIIGISSVEDMNLILEAINHGAYHVLVRPMRVDKLQRIWPFVLSLRRRALVRNQESASGEAKDQSSRNQEGTRGRKRSESGSEEVNQPHSHGNLMKKCRLVWTDELRRRFVAIVQRFGDKNVTPKRIMELMNEPKLTNANVTSYLQKYRFFLKKAKEAAMAASALLDGKNPELLDTASSNVKRRVGINEPIQINTEDIAGQIARYSKPNAATMPSVNSRRSQFMLEDMRMETYEVMERITSLGRGCNQHAQLCIRCPGPSDELSRRTLSFGGLVVNRDCVISNQMLDRGPPLEWQALGFGDQPSGFIPCHSHYGVENLERRSRDVSYDQISSVPRVRQTTMDWGIFGAAQEEGEPSRGNWNTQNNVTEDPVGNGDLSVNKSPKDSTAKMPIPLNSDTNHPETTDGEEADHSTVICHCNYE